MELVKYTEQSLYSFLLKSIVSKVTLADVSGTNDVAYQRKRRSQSDHGYQLSSTAPTNLDLVLSYAIWRLPFQRTSTAARPVNRDGAIKTTTRLDRRRRSPSAHFRESRDRFSRDSASQHALRYIKAPDLPTYLLTCRHLPMKSTIVFFSQIVTHQHKGDVIVDRLDTHRPSTSIPTGRCPTGSVGAATLLGSTRTAD